MGENKMSSSIYKQLPALDNHIWMTENLHLRLIQAVSRSLGETYQTHPGGWGKTTGDGRKAVKRTEHNKRSF